MGFKLIALSFSMLAVSFFVLKNSRLDSKSIQLEPSPPFTGKLAPNTKLQKATYLAKGKVRGPETVEVAPNGLIYTGLANGEVVSVDQSGTVKKIALIGNVKDESICKMEDDDPQCGRPAGMRLRGNYLYVADTYYGIVKIDVTNGKKTTVVNPNDKRFGDKPVKFANDLDIDEHGVIYFIDSSYLRQGYEVLEEFIEAQPRGRMFSYDERTDELKQLLDGLYFPNGIQLVASKQIVLINEITMARIVKYHLSGEKKGKVELFAVLPGFGDTLRLTPHQTILSPFAVVRDSKLPSLLDLLGDYPTIRNFIGSVVPPKLAWELAPKYGLLVEYDLDGNILKSWHDPSGKIVESTSSAFLHENKVYLGSVLRDYIAVVDY